MTAKLVVAFNVSLDGYIDHDAMAPDPELFAHWIEHARTVTGSFYGRVLYELMRYWDDDDPEWTPEHREFSQAWRSRPKWVVSRRLTSVGPNATLIAEDVEATLRDLKSRLTGEVQVGGSVLAGALTDLVLIDEYRLYLHPVVLGGGTPFFAGPRPPLRLMSSERIGASVMRLAYVPE